MSLGITLEVWGAVFREALRALFVPVRCLLHGIGRDRWKQRIRDALAADLDTSAELGHDEFVRMHSSRANGHVFVSAGEASGEGHAANLLRAIDASGHRARVTAFGGNRLREAGADVVYDLSERAVMGIAGVFSALPFIMGAFRRFLEMLRDDPPGLVVLVDYPGLHLVMARAAKRRGIPVLHYIAPQYWGWGPWRLARYRRAVDATLTILPFEPKFFAGEGLASGYVGHPLLDQLAQSEADTTRLPAGDDAPILCIMPGSRRKELELHLGPMVRIARTMRERFPNLRVVLPHRDPKREPLIRELLAEARGEDFVDVEIGDASAWLRRARAVLVKSGTGSLEATLCGAPAVVVYVLRGIVTRWGYDALLNAPWFAGANLIANRVVAPEFPIRDEADWDSAAAALEPLLRDGNERIESLRGVEDVRARLGTPGASARAAAWVTPFCEPKSSVDATAAS